MSVNSLPKTVTRQRRGCDLNPDLNPGPSVPEPTTLTTQLPSHPNLKLTVQYWETPTYKKIGQTAPLQCGIGWPHGTVVAFLILVT